MKSATSWLILATVLVTGLLAGRWIAESAKAGKPENSRKIAPRLTARPASDRRPQDKIHEREKGNYQADHEAMDAGALANQRTVQFSSRDALERFLAAIEGKGFAVLGRIDKLNLLRIGFLNADELADLLGDEGELGLIYPAETPGQGTVQDGAIGFGSAFLEWLGITGDRAGWGDGIKIAVLDTGVGTSSQFSNLIIQENWVELPSDPSEQNGHGTAVASLIASELGLAPDATILDFRIADDMGSSDTYLIAEAIIAAADQGADLINISLGSQGQSSILQQAVAYALEMGSLIVASAGNDGFDSVSYPAAYENVISVGAIDAAYDHLDFSNTGKVDLTAPGLALTSAWIEDQTVNFSGTSASAPIVTGAIAAVMSTQNVSASSAYETILTYTNEAGAVGSDVEYGAGIIDLGRVERGTTGDYTDLAIASNYFTTTDQGPTVVEVTVENRGTTQVINAPVTVTTSTGTTQLNITSLPAGKTQTFDIPLSNTDQSIEVQSSVQVSTGSADQNLSNNARSDTYSTADTP
ncbi:MAG: S8 family peptidase [Verrucomicrobiales bacterium]